MSAKDIFIGHGARSPIIEGIDLVADAVSTTLGPKGRNVAIEQSFGAPKVTKDGVTVAKAIEVKDKAKNLGAKLIIAAASKSGDIAGDGTTTTTVLTRAQIKEANKLVAAGMDPMQIVRGMKLAEKHILQDLKDRSKQITSSSEIAQVATISANGDKEIGDKIAEAMEKVGKGGSITVSESKGFDLELEVVEGMSFDRGNLSNYFVTNAEKYITELENPVILVHDKKISNIQPILPILEAAVQRSRPLLIIAEDVEGEALMTLVVNKMRGGLKVAAVKAPGFGDRRKAMLEDIAIVTGGILVSEEIGRKLENVKIDELGSASKVTISKDSTVIVGGAGVKSAIEDRCQEIKNQIASSDSDYDKEKLQERLAKLSGGVAVIKVGGATEVEVKEKKDRVEDALNATKAAVEEGIVPGGGMALFYARRKLDALKGENHEQNSGISIMKAALKAPLCQIVANAGGEGAVVANKLDESKDLNYGFDAAKMEYADMMKAGIIDPTKVVRSALENSVSIACSVITTETLIVESDKKDEGPKMPGGMGGMGGGMDF